MSTVSERLSALGTTSTSTLLDSASLAQRQNLRVMQEWLVLLEANQQAIRDLATRFSRQAATAATLWQQLVRDATEATDPFAVVRRARQVSEAVARLETLNQQVAANARRAETAAQRTEAALAALTAAQQEVSAGATRAEAAANRAQQIGDRLQKADEQVRASVERAETAARRAQGAGEAAEKVNDQVAAAARRVADTAEQLRHQAANGKAPTSPTGGDEKNSKPAAPRRSREAAKTEQNTPAAGEQETAGHKA